MLNKQNIRKGEYQKWNEEGKRRKKKFKCYTAKSKQVNEQKKKKYNTILCIRMDFQVRKLLPNE